ncbi:MAG: hypothetical protein IPL92_01280 [Saprospiraceae bacterium]|nr:hypothetical protein [Candidatus Opimibacter iunctus]
MKKYILIILLGAFLCQCEKSEFDDLSGSNTIGGVAIVKDTISGALSNYPLKKQEVFLRYKENSNGFLYSTYTNEQGQYLFNGINKDTTYIVYGFSGTEVKYYGEIEYSGRTSDDNIPDTLSLFISQKAQNGIHIIVQDTLGNGIGKVKVQVYSSPIIFATDSMAGYIFELNSNEYGIANKFSLAPGSYYFRCKINIGGLQFEGLDSIKIETEGVKTIVISMSDVTPDKNGMEIQLLDVYETPINKAHVFVYKSRSTFLLDTIDYSNYIYNLVSTDAGMATLYSIDSSKYYLRSVSIFNQDTLQQLDSIDVGLSNITTKVIILKE